MHLPKMTSTPTHYLSAGGHQRKVEQRTGLHKEARREGGSRGRPMQGYGKVKTGRVCARAKPQARDGTEGVASGAAPSSCTCVSSAISADYQTGTEEQYFDLVSGVQDIPRGQVCRRPSVQAGSLPKIHHELKTTGNPCDCTRQRVGENAGTHRPRSSVPTSGALSEGSGGFGLPRSSSPCCSPWRWPPLCFQADTFIRNSLLRMFCR